MNRDDVVHNKDCAMWIGQAGKHCSGWSFETCRGCRMAKLKSDGWIRSTQESDYLHIKRRNKA